MSNLQSGASKAQMIELLGSIKIPIMGAGGGFASIGAECYHEGTTAPVGWLICDGSVLNIADYPELATYYASHYGASNHFGGDGVTTFAVPTKEGMPNSVENYNTEEKIIGIYDNKPLYRKLYKQIRTSADANIIDITSLNVDRPVHIEGNSIITGNKTTDSNSASINLFIRRNVSGKDYISFVGNNASWYSDFDIIFDYTKTTDSTIQIGHSADGNGVFCVKATVAGDPNGHVYSTDEQVVGTWVDGKPIYEKAFSVTTPSSAGIAQWFNPSISIDTLVSISGVLKSTNDSITIGQGGSVIRVSAYYVRSNGYINSDIARSEECNKPCTLVLQYTKTGA